MRVDLFVWIINYALMVPSPFKLKPPLLRAAYPEKLPVSTATHGSTPDIAGKDIANPFAMIESARLMIEWLGHNRGIPQALEASTLMEKGIVKILSDAATRTGDIKGVAGTREMTQAIVSSL